MHFFQSLWEKHWYTLQCLDVQHIIFIWWCVVIQKAQIQTTFQKLSFRLVLKLRSRSSGSYGVTEWWRLEETSRGHVVHTPAQAGTPTAGCPSQCSGGFEDFQARRLHNLSGQPESLCFKAQVNNVKDEIDIQSSRYTEAQVCIKKRQFFGVPSPLDGGIVDT